MARSISALQKLLFQPQCWACGQTLSKTKDFCLPCRKQILRALQTEGSLLRYEGAVVGLLSCLRGSAPGSGSAWCLALLERIGKLEEWKRRQFHFLALAPQNPKKGEQGLHLLGGEIAKRLKIPLLQPFTKIGNRSQHGRNLGDRMDTAVFVRLKITGNKFQNKNVLLLDDVYTTGTTLDISAYLLRKAGAAEVEAFSLARQMVKGFEREKEQPKEEGEEVHPLLFHLFM